jgi:hypothetical protein
MGVEMSSAIQTTEARTESGSVERFAAQERRRTKLLLAFFIVLLSVPVAVGVFIYSTATSDSEVVAHHVGQQIATKLVPIEQNLKTAQDRAARVPQLDDEVAGQRKQLESLSEKVNQNSLNPEALRAEIQDLRTAIQKQESAQAQLLQEHRALQVEVQHISSTAVPSEEFNRLREQLRTL